MIAIAETINSYFPQRQDDASVNVERLPYAKGR
jgi:hypothetical protein